MGGQGLGGGGLLLYVRPTAWTGGAVCSVLADCRCCPFFAIIIAVERCQLAFFSSSLCRFIFIFVPMR